MKTIKLNPKYLPAVVSEAKWKKALAKQIAKEKKATHARDRLAAERRRLPMVRIEKDYIFTGPNGEVSLVDLFEGRSQLILYHFMFSPDVHGWPSGSLSGMFSLRRQSGSPCSSERERCHSRHGIARTAGKYFAVQEADGLDRAVVLVERERFQQGFWGHTDGRGRRNLWP